MAKKKRPVSGRKEGGMTRRRFIGMTAGATVALSLGTFIRSGRGAARVNVLTWSNTLPAMDDVLREQAKQYTKEKGMEVSFEFINQTDLPTKTAAAVESGAGPDIITLWSDGPHLHDKALIDIGDVAEPLGKELKGWTHIAIDIALVGKTGKPYPGESSPSASTTGPTGVKKSDTPRFPIPMTNSWLWPGS